VSAADTAEADDTPTPPPALRNIPADAYTARIVKQKVWRRCNVENQHWMGAIVGREGSGKSHTGVKILSTVDPTFSADRVFFDPKRLLETLQDDDLGPGTAVMIDEAGVGLGNRTWYEKDQILLNQALQTARDDNYAVCFTLPRLSELDSQTVGRLHSFIEMTALNKREGYADARWLRVDPARDESGKVYKQYPILRANGRQRKIDRVRFTPPPDTLIDRYEQRKESFKSELYQDAIDAIEEAESEDETTDPKEIAQGIATDGIGEYVSEDGRTGKPYINKDLIRVEHGISHSDARAVKSILKRTYDEKQLEKST